MLFNFPDGENILNFVLADGWCADHKSILALRVVNKKFRKVCWNLSVNDIWQDRYLLLDPPVPFGLFFLTNIAEQPTIVHDFPKTAKADPFLHWCENFKQQPKFSNWWDSFSKFTVPGDVNSEFWYKIMNGKMGRSSSDEPKNPLKRFRAALAFVDNPSSAIGFLLVRHDCFIAGNCGSSYRRTEKRIRVECAKMAVAHGAKVSDILDFKLILETFPPYPTMQEVKCHKALFQILLPAGGKALINEPYHITYQQLVDIDPKYCTPWKGFKRVRTYLILDAVRKRLSEWIINILIDAGADLSVQFAGETAAEMDVDERYPRLHEV